MATGATVKYGDHSVHQQWQKKVGLDYEYKVVRRRRYKYGELRKYRSGRVVYWAIRKEDESVYRENAWAIDFSTFQMLRIMNVKNIGILVDNGDKWIIDYEDFDKHKIRWDYSTQVGTLASSKGKMGALQWMVKFEHWVMKRGKPEDVEKVMKVGKWK